MTTSDETLIQRILDGDAFAFEELVERYQQKVFNIAFRMSGNQEDALDLSQESFLRAYRALHRFKGQSAFSTWLFRIVNNTCIDALRKRKRQPLVVMSTDAAIETEEGEYQIEFPAPESETPEEQAMSKELREQVQLALSRLSEEHRLALVLRDIEGYTYEEIAEMLELNIGTVKSRINRARLAIREQIGSMEQLRGNNRLSTQEGG
ncbi:MAG TPA: sigma-70 family RNA polymerase sigma factor [Bacillota bacterium]|nr:sigma-70 family RNA polymerase sigma factor [Bacillota bacterium]